MIGPIDILFLRVANNNNTRLLWSLWSYYIDYKLFAILTIWSGFIPWLKF